MPFIIFDGADVERVAAKATLAAIMNTGQDCASIGADWTRW